jgi:hypothetical protein
MIVKAKEDQEKNQKSSRRLLEESGKENLR